MKDKKIPQDNEGQPSAGAQDSSSSSSSGGSAKFSSSNSSGADGFLAPVEDLIDFIDPVPDTALSAAATALGTLSVSALIGSTSTQIVAFSQMGGGGNLDLSSAGSSGGDGGGSGGRGKVLIGSMECGTVQLGDRLLLGPTCSGAFIPVSEPALLPLS